MHPNCDLLFKKYAVSCFKDNMRILEVGPGEYPSPLQRIIRNHTITWETLDIYDTHNLTYLVNNAYAYPLPDNQYDIVVSTNVIEHVKKTWIWIKELSRVCKIGGKVILISPVSWGFHESPVDCWRIFPDGMKALYEEAGLKIDLCRCETLEKHRRGIKIPGITDGCDIHGHPQKRSIIKYFIKSILGWPVTCAIDTIAIGTKAG